MTGPPAGLRPIEPWVVWAALGVLVVVGVAAALTGSIGLVLLALIMLFVVPTLVRVLREQRRTLPVVARGDIDELREVKDRDGTVAAAAELRRRYPQFSRAAATQVVGDI